MHSINGVACCSSSSPSLDMSIHAGAYDDEEAAARAYDLAALKYRGPDTILNFPVGTAKIHSSIHHSSTPPHTVTLLPSLTDSLPSHEDISCCKILIRSWACVWISQLVQNLRCVCFCKL